MNIILFTFNCFLLGFTYVFGRMGHLCAFHACGGQRTCGSWLPPAFLWDPGTKLTSSVLAASTISRWTTLSVPTIGNFSMSHAITCNISQIIKLQKLSYSWHRKHPVNTKYLEQPGECEKFSGVTGKCEPFIWVTGMKLWASVNAAFLNNEPSI